MLPSPVSSGPRKGFKRLEAGPRRKLTKVLLSRSRFTNLGVVLLIILTFFSLYHNLRVWLSSNPHSNTSNICLPPVASLTHTTHEYFAKFGSTWRATVSHRLSSENLDHLVIVPGHAIWTGHDPKYRLNDSEWILEPYQKGKARLEALYQHIQRGLDIAREDKHALVVFSGGQTRLQSIMTEAQSYLRLALLGDPTSSSQDVSGRLTTEDFALDSFQNLLFSIARFKEFTGRYPDRVSIVGYEFKKSRFEKLHRTAIRWPETKFAYYGINPDDLDHVRIASNGEVSVAISDPPTSTSDNAPRPFHTKRENGFIPYSKDSYGCHPPLIEKRRQRNPFRRFHSYHLSAPELNQLLDWCPDTQDGGWTKIYLEPLPWDLLS